MLKALGLIPCTTVSIVVTVMRDLKGSRVDVGKLVKKL
jgi:hypothetical protein